MEDLISTRIALNFNKLNHRAWQKAVLFVEGRGISQEITGMLESWRKVSVSTISSIVDLGTHREATTTTIITIVTKLVWEEGKRYPQGFLQ